MKTFAALLFATIVSSTCMLAQLNFGGGPHLGLAFTSLKKPVGDAYGTGAIFGAHGEVDINKFITLRLSFDYTTVGADAAKLKTAVTQQFIQEIEKLVGVPLDDQAKAAITSSITSVSGGRASAPAIGVSGLGKLPTGTTVTPYGIVGFGINFLSNSDLTIESTGLTVNGGQVLNPGTNTKKLDSETKFGMNFGAGAEMKLNKLVKLYLELRYNIIFTEGGSSSIFPVVVGATFGI